MKRRTFLKSFFMRTSIAWMGLCLIAFANGAYREIVLVKNLGLNQLLANQVSCFTGIVFLTIFVYGFWLQLEIENLKKATIVGVTWFIATFIFETFIMERNLSRDQILQSYNILSGQYWGIVLLWILILPALVFCLQKIKR